MLSDNSNHTESISVLSSFLDFLEQDIDKNLSHMQLIDKQLILRARELTAGVSIDINAALADDKQKPTILHYPFSLSALPSA